MRNQARTNWKAKADVYVQAVRDIVTELKEYNCNVDVYDPWVKIEESQQQYGITPIETLSAGSYDAIILTVAHQSFKEMGSNAFRALGKLKHVLYDLKYLLSANESDIRL